MPHFYSNMSWDTSWEQEMGRLVWTSFWCMCNSALCMCTVSFDILERMPYYHVMPMHNWGCSQLNRMQKSHRKRKAYACNPSALKGGVEAGGLLQFAGCQPSCRFSERPWLRGVGRKVTAAHPWSPFTHAHIHACKHMCSPPHRHYTQKDSVLYFIVLHFFYFKWFKREEQNPNEPQKRRLAPVCRPGF